MYQYVVMKGRM